MAKWVKKEEDEQIVGELAEVGGAVYPIPEMGEIPPDASPVVGNWADHNRFDGWVAEVQYTFYDAPAGGSPYAQDQAISVARSDIAYGTNNDPVIHPTPSAALTPPDVPFGAVGNAKPFPPRHDQAAYHVATGDPVLVIPGKDNKNWYLNDELPFVAEITAFVQGSGGYATVKRKSLSTDPAGGGFAGAALADLLDKDGSLVTYTKVKVLNPNSQYHLAVGDVVWVQRRGRYYFITGDYPPVGTKNSRQLHNGSIWTAIRHGVMEVATDNGDGTYVGTEQQWDDDAGDWIDATATGFLDAATFQEIEKQTGGTVGGHYNFTQMVDEDGNVDNFVTLGGTSTDVKVAVDSSATAGYIGHAKDDGVLRTGEAATFGLDYADGGDWVTLSVNDAYINTLICTNASVIAAAKTVSTDLAGAAGYLGVATDDGVLRTDATMTVADGGGFITLSVVEQGKVKVDAAATAGYLGIDAFTGVLRSDTTVVWTDGGDFVSMSIPLLGLDALSDPGGDRILFWDDSATALKWLAIDGTLTITDTTLSVT